MITVSLMHGRPLSPGMLRHPSGFASSRPALAVRQLRKRSVAVQSQILKQILEAGVVTTAAAAAPIMLQFTPYQALVGGICLGVATVGKLALTGRILGISGIVRGFVSNQIKSWRVAFTLGLLGGGYIAAGITPDAFDALPSTYTLGRAGLGGALVGLGASLGNGCTSGHGISGLSRLSPRSLAYVVAFMLAGAAAATLSGTPDALGLAAITAKFAAPSDDVLYSGGLLLAMAVLSHVGLAAVADQVQTKKPIELLAELLAGVTFAFGLTYAGMVRPSKVAGFLAVTHPAWDPSLMFVMGGAILVALPGFTYLIRNKGLAKPLLGERFHLPTNISIDPKLLLGGVLFGSGWGISGMCPGPALVALAAAPCQQVATFVAAMMAGMWVEGLFSGIKPGNMKPA